MGRKIASFMKFLSETLTLLSVVIVGVSLLHAYLSPGTDTGAMPLDSVCVLMFGAIGFVAAFCWGALHILVNHLRED